MELFRRKEGNAAVVSVKGRLDAVSSPEVEKELDRLIVEGERRLILDFGGLDYISSAGLRVVLAATKKLKGKEGTLFIASLGSMVKEVFEISGFGAIIPIFSSVDEALIRIE
jgi:anti-anti-sigma factor